MNMLLWPVMLYELNEFIKHREMDDDLAFEWETSKVIEENNRNAPYTSSDRVIYVCGSAQSGKSCLLERILLAPKAAAESSLVDNSELQLLDSKDNIHTHDTSISSQIQIGYRATHLVQEGDEDGTVYFQIFYEIPPKNMNLMDLLLNGSESIDPKLPNCVIIVSDPTSENCMEELEYFYNDVIMRLGSNSNEVFSSQGLLDSCEIIVVASKLDLMEPVDHEAEDGIVYKIKEFADTNGVKFVGWSQSDRKDSEYLAELSKQIKSCLPVVKSPMRKRNEEEFSPLHVKSGYINGMYHEANAKNTTTKLTRRQL